MPSRHGLSKCNTMQSCWTRWTVDKLLLIVPFTTIFLRLEGVDTISRIELNGKVLGSTWNMFVEYSFEIPKGLLQETDNLITISIVSPVSYANKAAFDYIKREKYPVPPTSRSALQHGESNVQFIRKMQSSFSWDWGPAFPSMGIWKSAYLEFRQFNSVQIENVVINTILDEETNKWFVNSTVFLSGSSEMMNGMSFLPSTVSYSIDGYPQESMNSTIFRAPEGPDSALRTFSNIFEVKLPSGIQVWWPNGVYTVKKGQGAVDLGRKLYDLQISIRLPHFTLSHYYGLSGRAVKERNNHWMTWTHAMQSDASRYFDQSNNGQREVISRSVSVGFRKVELVMDELRPAGETFYFKINGIAIFMKGSNWIPSNILPELQTKEYVTHLLTSAAAANMNMLRVWGGGIYESEWFYSLADSLGIMIWQDLMFAVAMYPTDDVFINAVKDEVRQNVRRLQHHPCIAVWAGNNENEAALASHWFPETLVNTKRYHDDYRKLYVDVIMPIVHKEDPSRVYLTSSPSNGKKTMEEDFLARDPQDPRYGDVHHYDYFRDGWDWTHYPSARFVSEYGFQSYPSVFSWISAVGKDPLSVPFKPAVSYRNHHPGGDAEMAAMIARHFPMPPVGGLASFTALVYLSQITQAESIRTETEFYRRNRELDVMTGQGKTMGALYWQLNDVWVAPTWASIEFSGRWKILHYYALNMFKPILVSPYVDRDKKTVKISIVSDFLVTTGLLVTIQVFKFDSFVPAFTEVKAFQAPANDAQIVYEVSKEELLKKGNCESSLYCLMRTLYVGTETFVAGDNFLLLSEPKDLILKKAMIMIKDIIKISNDGRHRYLGESETHYSIRLKTNTPTLFVSLSMTHPDLQLGRFSDNGFMMLEPEKVIEFYPKVGNGTIDLMSEEDFRGNIHIRSFN